MSEWMAIGSACPMSSDREAAIERRKELLHFVAAGAIKARSFRPKRVRTEFLREYDLEIFAKVVRQGILDQCHFPLCSGISEASEEDFCGVKFIELMGTPLETSAKWVNQTRNDFYISQSKTNWELGHFHKRTLSYAKREFGYDDSIGFLYWESDVYSVEVESEAVTRLLGSNVPAAFAPEQQSSKYDWEAAFADVAARFYHDVVFENIEARGVQADIERLLMASFENRRGAVPSPETCKPKARKLLGALRGAKPKQPQ